MNYYSNRYWKYLLLLVLTLLSILFSVPNLYGEDPALQISNRHGRSMTDDTMARVKKTLKKSQIDAIAFERQNGSQLIRFRDVNVQLRARDILKEALGSDYIVALNLASKTPAWLQALGVQPLKLGLDLRGGVHFLLNVDINTVIEARQQGNVRSMGKALREANIRYTSIHALPEHKLQLSFHNSDSRDRAMSLLKRQFAEYRFSVADNKAARGYQLWGELPPQQITKINDYVIEQTITILRNRVNELGVSEAIVQRQGAHHVSVDLPGMQDTARAKDLIGKTATLRFQLVDTEHDVAAAIAGIVPANSRLYYDENKRPVLLKNQIILKGSAITYATAVFREGRPAVNIRLGGGGESLFHRVTTKNIGQPLAVVYVETKVEKQGVHRKHERVISVATIQSALGNNFDITGLSSAKYAANLALLLRSGALEAPTDIVEELTVGPSLGKANIQKGILSLEIGSLLVIVFMGLYYRLFGMIANLALGLNILFIVAILSALGATLTLPGIAGIVLTVGMAVDANVLINERIREELRRGMSPLASIKAGYELAFATIVDANVTTLIVAVILFALGSGPVKGFAVTLIIGLLCSMVTSIYFTRAIVELIYVRNKPVKKLSVGI